MWLMVSAQAASIWEGGWLLTLSARSGVSLSTFSLSTGTGGCLCHSHGSEALGSLTWPPQVSNTPSLRTSSAPHAGGAKEATLWLLEEMD